MGNPGERQEDEPIYLGGGLWGWPDKIEEVAEDVPKTISREAEKYRQGVERDGPPTMTGMF